MVDPGVAEIDGDGDNRVEAVLCSCLSVSVVLSIKKTFSYVYLQLSINT